MQTLVIRSGRDLLKTPALCVCDSLTGVCQGMGRPVPLSQALLDTIAYIGE